MLKRLIICAAFPGIAACTATPPAPPVARPATTVDVSFARTWVAAVAELAERNVAIKTMDRASGLIATEDLSVPLQFAAYADCGTDMYHHPIPATRARYNTMVTGDSSASTVHVNARWITVVEASRMSLAATEGWQGVECSSRGSFESTLELSVKWRAEAKPSLAK